MAKVHSISVKSLNEKEREKERYMNVFEEPKWPIRSKRENMSSKVSMSRENMTSKVFHVSNTNKYIYKVLIRLGSTKETELI